jgi:ribonuclease J
MNNELLRLTPLGGTNEIGANFTLVNSKNVNIIIDCGIKFPSTHYFSVQYLGPQLDLINENEKYHLVITHGHEDHIGYISHLLLKNKNIIIYGTEFTLLLVEQKFPGLEFKNKVILKNFANIDFGHFKLVPFEVDHSIPQSVNFLFQFENFNYLHLTDLRYVDKTHQSIQTIKNEYLNKKLLLSLDSTNILGQNNSDEKSIITQLTKHIESHSRVFLTMFSSNIERLKNILNIAKQSKKDVFILGHALEMYMKIGTKAKVLSNQDLVPIKDSKLYSQSKNKLVLVSGCQGTHKSALHHLSLGKYKGISCQKNDLFLFSSKTIPGNELKLASIYDRFTQQEVKIITASQDQIHASGHLDSHEMKKIIDALKPDSIIPIHGNLFFTQELRNWILSQNYSSSIQRIQNGQALSVYDPFSIKKHSLNNEHNMLFFDYNKVEYKKSTLKERMDMAEFGLINIFQSNKKFKIDTLGINHDQQVIEDFLNQKLKLDKAKTSQSLNSNIQTILFKKFKIKPIIKTYL